MTLLIGLLLHKTIGFRVSEEEERTGVDEAEHAETGYDLGTLGAGHARHVVRPARRQSRTKQETEKNDERRCRHEARNSDHQAAYVG